MKHKFKTSRFRLAVLMMCLVLPSALRASIKIGELYYNLNQGTKTAEVTYYDLNSNQNYVSGELIIPETLTYSSQDYSVTSIGEGAFQYCSGLTSVTIPNSVTSIGKSAFYHCAGLTSITIGNSVTSIEDYAFSYCSEISSFSIPNSVTSIGNLVFYGCSSLADVKIEDGDNTLSLGYNSSSSGLFAPCPLEKLHIGRTLSYKTGSYYGYSPFANKKTLKTVEIGNKVTEIPSYLFYGCSALTSISIPNSVTSIGEYAFSNCSGLTSFSIPNSVSSIRDSAFSKCSSLVDVIIEDGDNTLRLGIKPYSGEPFESSPLERLYIGRTLSYSCYSNEYSPFSNKWNLKMVEIGNKVTEIPSYLFYGCSALTSISIPNSVTSIGEYAFYNCSGISSFTIPNSITSIGNNAFYGCSSLVDVKIEEGHNTLSLGYNSSSGLFGSSPLENLYIGRTLSYYSGSSNGYSPFANKNALKKVEIGNKVTEIPSYLFYGCSALTSISIPNSVTSIGEYAFSNCTGLTSFSIPNSVTSIGNLAFYGCSSLVDVKIEDGDNTLSLGYNSSYSGLFEPCPLEKLHIGRTLSYKTGSYYGYSPFANKKALKKVEIGNKVTEIPSYLFYGCSALTSISIPNSVTSIGDYVFNGCTNLAEIEYIVGKSFAEISSYTFDTNLCKNLNVSPKNKAIEILTNKQWNIFNNIYYKENDKYYIPVFYECELAPSKAFYSNQNGCLVEKGKDVTLKSDNYVAMAFHRGNDISRDLTTNDGYTFTPTDYWSQNVITGYSGDKSQTITIAEAGSLFDLLGLQNIQNIESLTIIGNINGTDIMTINRMTLLKHLNLKEANIVEGGATYRDNLKTENNVVGSYFFHTCDSLQNVILPTSATSISSYAFHNRQSIKNVILGENIYSIGTYAFYNCSNLMAITIPSSVNRIESYAFKQCSNLKTLNLEKGISELSLSTNDNSSYYNEIKVSFSDCPLETVFIGRPLRNLTSSSSNYSPFSDKKTIVSALVDKKGTIEYYLFDGCYNLKHLIIGDEITSISDYAFRNCKSLKNIILPIELSSIGKYAFSNCSSLEEIVIPNGVNSLPTDCFSNCTSLEKLMLGSGMTSINDNAFSNCSAIKQLRSLAPLPPVITSTVFKAVNKNNCQLIVTKGNLVYYWLDPVWKEFINISDALLCLSPLPALKYGDAPISLTDYAPEGVTLSYETSNPEVARIDGSLLSIVGAGVATIGALYDVDNTPMEIIGQMRQFFVDKADLTLSAENYTIEVGKPIPQFTMTAAGLCYDDKLEDVGELPEFYCDADENSQPGEYPIYLVGGKSNNYNLDLVAGTLKIVGESEGSSVGKLLESENSDKRIKVFNINGVMVYEGLKEEMKLSSGVYIIITETGKTYKIVK